MTSAAVAGMSMTPDDSPEARARLARDLRELEMLTTRMLEAGADANWEMVGDLEARRGELLRGLPGRFHPADRVHVQEVLQSALTATHHITGLIRRFQADEGASVDALRHGSRAALTYLNIAAAP